MSNLTTVTFSGIEQANLTLYNYFWFLALIIKLAPSRLNSYAKNSPIPDDAPVIQTFLFVKFGLHKKRFTILKIE